jgi:MFS family permease
MVEQVATADGEARPFEWWMTSNLALGLAFNCFLPVLLPSYVLSVGGTTADVWVAMSTAGLFALLGPSIGRLAGRHRAQRLVQVLGMLGMSLGLVALALCHGDSLALVLAIAVMGIGAAAVAVAAPQFIVASDLPAELQARQLTWLQLNLDLGKIVGGLLLVTMATGGATGGLSLATQFLLGGLILGLLGVLVWTTSRRAASRIRQPEVDHTARGVPSRTVVPWRTLLLSLFGVPVVAQLLGSMTMMEVRISTMLAVSGLVGLGLYFLAGRWMTRCHPSLVWATGHVLRGVAGVALGVLGLARAAPYLVVLAAFLALESTPAIAWLLQTRASARAASPQTAAATAAVATSRPIVPTGRLDQRASRHAESLGVLVPASPSPVLSRLI